MLLDEIAREFPQLLIVIARLGYPWVHQAVVLLAKHPNVFANVAGLLPHPWLGYSSLLAANEYGVTHKLLFGSDYPFTTVQASIDGLRSLNRLVEGTNLPRLDSQQLEALIHRDSLRLLGLEG
jgi:hypothetical protein